MSDRAFIQALLDASETGIVLNGPNPWDPQIHDERYYRRILAGGSLALGETYMDGWWDCDDLEGLYTRAIRAKLQQRFGMNLQVMLKFTTAALFNLQSKIGAQQAIDAHYEENNTRAFEYIYDKSMAASCAYYPNGGEDLETAQIKKFKLVCDKIGLKRGDRLLDIGCGWGSLAAYAAGERGAIVTGITRSVSQAEYIRKRYKDLPITVIRADYREANLTEKFDHVASIEMFGHVGRQNYGSFFKVARDAIKDNGLFLLQETVFNKRARRLDPFIDKYIFPNGEAPSPGLAISASEGTFVFEDYHNLGPMLGETLSAWQRNMERNKDVVIEMLGERWYRMMTIYHTSCAATYKTRIVGCGQFVFSPEGVPGGYRAVR